MYTRSSGTGSFPGAVVFLTCFCVTNYLNFTALSNTTYYLTVSKSREPECGLAPPSASLSLTSCTQGVGQGWVFIWRLDWDRVGHKLRAASGSSWRATEGAQAPYSLRDESFLPSAPFCSSHGDCLHRGVFNKICLYHQNCFCNHSLTYTNVNWSLRRHREGVQHFEG